LQALSIDQFQFRMFRFQQRNTPLRLIVRNITLLLLIAILAVCQRLIVEPTASFKLLFKYLSLFLGWVNPILKTLSHMREYNRVLGKLQMLPRTERTICTRIARSKGA